MSMLKYHNIYPSGHAVLCGSGPSFSADVELPADAVICAVNEVALKLVQVDYVFANDAAPWAARLTGETRFFYPERTPLAVEVGCQAVAFADAAEDGRLYCPPAQLARCGLYAAEGTINSAIQILAIMGIERITCIGLDGDRPPYDHIRAKFEAFARRFGITLHFVE